MEKIEEHPTSSTLHTPCALVNASSISFEHFEGSPTDQSIISQVSLLLNELSRQLCTNLNNDEDDWSVDDYVRIVDSTGWRTSRRYLFVSLARCWGSLGLLRQYKTLFDLLGVESITKDERYSPDQLWTVLRHEFAIAVSRPLSLFLCQRIKVELT